MLQLYETASGLTIRHPIWLGLIGLAVGYALVFWLLKAARGSKKPVQHAIAGIVGFIVVSLVCFSALLDDTTLDSAGARESRLLSGVRSAAWKDVAEATVEQRRSGRKGMLPHLVLRLAPQGEVAMVIDGLDPGEIERVVAYARARVRK